MPGSFNLNLSYQFIISDIWIVRGVDYMTVVIKDSVDGNAVVLSGQHEGQLLRVVALGARVLVVLMTVFMNELKHKQN